MKYLAAPDDLSDDHFAFNCAYKCLGGCAHLTCGNLAGRVKCTFIFCPFKALVYKWWGTVSSPDISTVSGSTDFSYSHLCFCFILDATHLSFEPVSYLCCFLCIEYDPQNNCYREVLLKDQYSQQQRFCQLSEYLRIPLHRTLLIFPLLGPSWHFPTLSLGPDVRPCFSACMASYVAVTSCTPFPLGNVPANQILFSLYQQGLASPFFYKFTEGFV